MSNFNTEKIPYLLDKIIVQELESTNDPTKFNLVGKVQISVDKLIKVE
jgi:hypothetical protein